MCLDNPLSAQFARSPAACVITMTCINLCPPNREFVVEPLLYIRSHLAGAGDRKFPGLSITAKVKRKPFFHLVHQAIPMTLFSLLAVCTAAGRRVDQISHRAHLTMILVLTAATYRIASSRVMPAINYVSAQPRLYLVVHCLPRSTVLTIPSPLLRAHAPWSLVCSLRQWIMLSVDCCRVRDRVANLNGRPTTEH